MEEPKCCFCGTSLPQNPPEGMPVKGTMVCEKCSEQPKPTLPISDIEQQRWEQFCKQYPQKDPKDTSIKPIWSHGFYAGWYEGQKQNEETD